MAGRDKAARAAAEGFAERAGENVDAATACAAIDEAPVLVRAATECAHHAVAVAVVDDEHRVVLITQFSHRGQISDGTLHAEDAVGHDPDLARHILVLASGLQCGSQ